MMPLILVALSLLVIIAEAQSNPAKAHEYIRAVQEDGVWRFQDGSGRRFFTLGMNCVDGCYGHAEEAPIDASRKARIVSVLRDWGFNTVEARIPTTAVRGFKGQAGALWKIKLIYQNVNEIYWTGWEGLVTLRRGPEIAP